jgi:predicted nuclease of restriction endonuclease-like (RecB) superfamily
MEPVPAGYGSWLRSLKGRLRDAQLQAHRTVNAELIGLYWDIGREIVEQQASQGWGAGVVRRLAVDLGTEFPGMQGFSFTNLNYMRSFARAWPEPIFQQAVGRLPWGHITVLLGKLDDRDTRDWYAERAVVEGWSRNVLTHQIMSRAHLRAGAAPSNFATELEPADSELAQQMAKDPYVFDFLQLASPIAERQLEEGLMDQMVQTLQELGTGFAFVGRQVHFDVNGDDFYLDLLFFHVEQLRYVVVELKAGKFMPEHAGKLQFYVALVDDRLRRPAHTPTVGILICASRNEQTVRYALSRAGSPMAVSTYTYESLPPDEQLVLPRPADLAVEPPAEGEPTE